MKIRSYGNAILFAGAFLLIGALATAQGPAASQKNIPAREASSGHASGRQDQFPKASGARTLGSAHASESLDSAAATDAAKRGSMNKAQSNPMYKSSGNSGQNPLFEPKDKSAQSSRKSGSVIFQDRTGEDSSARHRAGNNKAASSKSTGTQAPAPATHK